MKLSYKLWWVVFALACVSWIYPAFSNQQDDEEFIVNYFGTTRYCLSCHAVDRVLVGPAYKEIAKKGKSDDELVQSILNGSKGKWGSIPMPANKITEAEAYRLAKYINNLK